MTLSNINISTANSYSDEIRASIEENYANGYSSSVTKIALSDETNGLTSLSADYFIRDYDNLDMNKFKPLQLQDIPNAHILMTGNVQVTWNTTMQLISSAEDPNTAYNTNADAFSNAVSNGHFAASLSSKSSVLAGVTASNLVTSGYTMLLVTNFEPTFAPTKKSGGDQSKTAKFKKNLQDYFYVAIIAGIIIFFVPYTYFTYRYLKKRKDGSVHITGGERDIRVDRENDGKYS
jgi:hypothetical protein